MSAPESLPRRAEPSDPPRHPGESLDAYRARLDALAAPRTDAAPGPARERFG